MTTSGWFTVQTKDGKKRLDNPFYATNPAYIAAHREWDWVKCDGELAAAEIQRLHIESGIPCAL